MLKIKQLPSYVFNQISAGEVVERPSSVVKELVENSIDAGADNIIVEIEQGGLKSIKIIDNGSGVGKDDIKTAFLPHATSKIAKASDLSEVATLGFRGEALPSIASVSICTMTSKTADSELAYKYQLKGGEEVEFLPCNHGVGTTICIENLFFNTPARLKFLKRPSTEQNYVLNVMSNLMFANPNIAFEVICDSKVVYRTNGNEIENVIKTVYNKNFLKDLLPVNYDNHSMKISGYVSNKDLYKSNRTYQTVILNGRNITNVLISQAVQKAYGNSLMTRCFPVFILDIVMPFNEVDINVHPAKAEVRFADTQKVFSIVYTAVTRALLQLDEQIPSLNNSENTENEEINVEIKSTLKNISISNKTPRKTEIQTEADEPLKYSHSDSPKSIKSNILDFISHSKNSVSESNTGLASYSDEIIDNVTTSVEEDNTSIKQDEFNLQKDFKIVGQLFDTYIIIEYQNKAFIIDQHASMERLNYDNLMQNLGNLQIQPLLVPFIINLNPIEFENIMKIEKALGDIGIEIENFGNNSIKVNSLPNILANCNIKRLFDTILSKSFNNKDIGETLTDKIAKMACKSSIKGGDTLNKTQISLLLDNFKSGKIPLQCPHGRPAVIKISNTEIEKWFKRIV